MLFQVGELFGDLRLWQLKRFLDMANAEWTASQKIDYAEAAFVGECFVNGYGVHWASMRYE